MKVVVFGAGSFGRKYIQECEDDTEIVAVCDNNWENIRLVCGHKVQHPSVIKKLYFDYVVIAIDEFSIAGLQNIQDIKIELLDIGVPENKILLMSNYGGQDNRVDYPRVEFLVSFAETCASDSVDGAIAECGVFRGHFAQKMDEVFADRRLYLFDTFSGFDVRDMNCADELMNKKTMAHLSETFAQTSQDLVRLKLKNRDRVIIKQGYVPETFEGLDDERFLFVNLDMDLYQPTLAALRFFRDKMVDGGLILVHDYVTQNIIYEWGVRKAVDDFAMECPVLKLPIGDIASIAIIIK